MISWAMSSRLYSGHGISCLGVWHVRQTTPPVYAFLMDVWALKHKFFWRRAV